MSDQALEAPEKVTIIDDGSVSLGALWLLLTTPVMDARTRARWSAEAEERSDAPDEGAHARLSLGQALLP